MKRLIVYLKQPCRAWVLALAVSLAFFACSNGDDVAGGVTDIGNSIAREPDTTKIAGTVVDMQGNRMPAARLTLYWDNGYAIEDSVETVADYLIRKKQELSAGSDMPEANPINYF